MEVKLETLIHDVESLRDNNKWLIRLVLTGLISGVIAYFWRNNGAPL